MIYKIICVGRIKEQYLNDKISEYEKKINGRDRVVIVQVDDEKIPKNSSETINRKIVEVECEKIEKHIENDEYVIALCIEGKQCSSSELGQIIDRAGDKGYDKITFIIGGSLGLTDKLIRKADFKLSFSAMTFPHQLMRVMLLDAICSNRLFIYDK
jgi:23S rRNA (pseudouridine1915-N3)-methyltransferase